MFQGRIATTYLKPTGLAMSVSRSITVRIVSPYENCVDILTEFTKNFWSYNDDRTITTLGVDDQDDYNFIDLNISNALEALTQRENKGWCNHINLWSKDYAESFLVRITKLENTYTGCKSHYELSFNLGIGKRLEKAERYTDYGHYLKLLIPHLLQMGCYVCEFSCNDYDS